MYNQLKLNDSLVSAILQIPWFSKVGEELNPESENGFPSFVTVHSWDDALSGLRDPLWEWTAIEAQNEITAYLSAHYREDYREWNSLVRKAVSFFRQSVILPIPVDSLDGLAIKTITDWVSWDICHALVEDVYKKFGIPTDHYERLLAVYKSGHIPCGWTDGVWPKGRLVIY